MSPESLSFWRKDHLFIVVTPRSLQIWAYLILNNICSMNMNVKEKWSGADDDVVVFVLFIY